MNMKINEQIAALRKQKGVTQGELAGALGVSNQSVSKWESGQCCPDIQLLPDLARFFEVSIDELMGIEQLKNDTKVICDEKNDADINDPLLDKALDLLGGKMLITTAVLQRKMGIGYLRAKELIESMAAMGYIVEVKSGFYRMIRSQQDFTKTIVKSVISRGREAVLDVALAMHAAWFYKVQQADSTENAIDAVIGGQWGYSAFSEPDMTTVMRGQSVFYSKNTALDYSDERIGKLCLLMRTLADRKHLKVLASLYELTVHAEEAYVGADEIAGKSGLTPEEVSALLDGGLLPLVSEQDGRYRIRGEAMAILPILSMLTY